MKPFPKHIPIDPIVWEISRLDKHISFSMGRLQLGLIPPEATPEYFVEHLFQTSDDPAASKVRSGQVMFVSWGPWQLFFFFGQLCAEETACKPVTLCDRKVYCFDP
jgi:hypothetical protein